MYVENIERTKRELRNWFFSISTDRPIVVEGKTLSYPEIVININKKMDFIFSQLLDNALRDHSVRIGVHVSSNTVTGNVVVPLDVDVTYSIEGLNFVRSMEKYPFIKDNLQNDSRIYPQMGNGEMIIRYDTVLGSVFINLSVPNGYSLFREHINSIISKENIPLYTLEKSMKTMRDILDIVLDINYTVEQVYSDFYTDFKRAMLHNQEFRTAVEERY